MRDGTVNIMWFLYLRLVFYGEKLRAIDETLTKLCEWKSVNITEAKCCADNAHMIFRYYLT